MGYDVTDTRQVRDMTPSGQSKTVYRVWIQTDKGATGSFEVSPDDWETEKLKERFAAEAEKLDLAFAVSTEARK